MTKYSVDTGPDRSPGHVAELLLPPSPGGAVACELYAPGHLMHYKHQGNAVHSPSRKVRDTLLDGTSLTLLLPEGPELHWRHHDPERLRQMLELLHGRCVAYPEFHALRVGPYWFNCASERFQWQDCRLRPRGDRGGSPD
jgi:hypothetical protein